MIPQPKPSFIGTLYMAPSLHKGMYKYIFQFPYANNINDNFR